MSDSLRVNSSVQRSDGFRLEAELSVPVGETVAVMGSSGAGKSTLLSAIMGTEPSARGGVWVGDVDVSRLPVQRRGVVLLGQDPRLFPHLNARDNVAFGLQAQGVSRADARRQAPEWLARVGLPDASARLPRELSGGQQQRVAIARALATRPKVMLLDEPLTSLDPVTSSGIRSVLADQLAGVTTIMVTHDVVDAAAVATRLLVLENGRVTQDGPVREVLSAPATQFGAALAGLNRVVGEVKNGVYSADGMRLAASGSGQVAALFRPSDVTIGEGGWRAVVERLESTPVGVRIFTLNPAVAIDVSVEDVAVRGIAPGALLPLVTDPSAVRFMALVGA